MKKDKVSIIIPTYNREQFLLKCFTSLFEQIHRPLEIIIIDDGSNDKTFETVQKCIKKFSSTEFKILYFYQENSGAPSARNRGIRESSGDWLQFLDSDDYLENDKISVQLDSLKEKKAELAVCDYKIFNINNKKSFKIRSNGDLLLKVANGHSIFTGAALISRKIIEKGILWNENLFREQDKEFLFKVLFASKKYVYNSNTYAIYIKHNFSQITDIYSKTEPQALEVIKSNLKYIIKFKRYLGPYKFILIINPILHIVLRFNIIYKFKTKLRKIISQIIKF